MKKLSFLMVALVIILAACGGDNASGTEDGEFEERTWKIGFNTVEGSVRDVAAKKFKEVVEAETDGAITVEIYPNEELGSAQEMIESVQVGALDMQIAGANMMANTVPEYAALSLPFLVKDFDEAHAILDSEIGDKLKEKGQEHGLKVLSDVELGFAQITNNKQPINKPEDLKGLKMRSPNDVSLIETFKTLGSSVSTMPFTEVYLALSQGVVDGQFNPLDAIYETKFHEVQDHLAMLNFTYYYSYFIMNQSTFDGMEPELQKIVQEAANEARDASYEFTASKDEEMLDEMEDSFVEITEPDVAPFQEKVQPVYTKMEDTMGAEIINDIQTFLEEYRSEQ
ncbi:C4-dicarboxylate ABC transporter [Thalassobacillus devorans]|uniref:C4-dicarboxylate ABC transporter n=1 Tax=Thalassobacillus devorans TaxID=279813 RepID=A0ABQ1NGR4_9BACI|nr:TRAP transporter substrate-binding protein [Thalassobacillus devorans]NIK27316.1 C4-dicarboxylate-binding protein DctP [Thalassobacillus devorans]GGC76737.1 C4-dicarboxylate ABC transporter [Thalassobacillus devorans]